MRCVTSMNVLNVESDTNSLGKDKLFWKFFTLIALFFIRTSKFKFMLTVLIFL